MKKIILSMGVMIVLTACGARDPLADKGYNKDGIPTTESGFYESSSSKIGQEFLLSTTDTIQFDYNSFSLTVDAIAILDSQIAFIKKNKNVKIVIEGHTDERGTREYNLALGEKRASIVKAYFKANGIDVKSINAISYGKERPIWELHNEESWTKNRRAKTIIM